MRLAELQLDRYGRFEGQRLDFGPAADQDIHLIFGPNEAGKSTIFAAMEDLFFGIAERPRYAFRFERALLRVVGRIEAGGIGRAVARIHDRKTPLLDDLSAPLPESVFGPEIERLDRATYRAMFSLDEASLREGGQNILNAEGDAAEILFGSSLGLADVSERLQAMRKAADQLYRWRSPTTRLYELRAELRTIRENQKAADLNATTYDRLREGRDQAADAAKAAEADLREVRLTLERQRRLEGAFPTFQAYLADAPKLAELKDLPTPPANWAKRAATLQEADGALRTRVATAQERLKALQAAMETAPTDPSALALVDRMQALAELEGKHRGALGSIPSRASDIADLQREADAIGARLSDGRDRPTAAYCLPPDKLAELDRLASEYISLDANARNARDEFDAARENAASGIELPAEAQARLAGAAAAAKDGDAKGDCSRAEAVVVAAAEALADARAALAPWRGDIEGLPGQPPPPPARIEDWRAGEQTLHAETLDVQARRRTLEEAGHARRLAATGAPAPPGIEDTAFQQLRAARDALWQGHLDAMDMQSAAAYWRKAAEVDAAADARLANADALAAARQAEAADARDALEAAKLDADAAGIAARRTVLTTELDAAAAALGLPGGTTPSELADWLARRDAALARRDAHAAARRAATEARDRLAQLTDALSHALEAAGVATSDGAALPTLQALADDLLEKASAGAVAKRDLERRQKAHDAAKARLSDWSARWAAALAGSWLEDREADAAFVRNALQDINRLREKLDSITDLQLRIRQMQDDQVAFATEAAAIAETLGLTSDSDDPLELAEASRNRVQAAIRADVERKTLEGQRDKEAAALLEHEAALRAHRAEIGEMAAFLGVAGLREAQTKLAEIEARDRLGTAQSDRATALRRAADVDTIEAALKAFEGLSETELAVEIQEQAALTEALVAAADDARLAAREAAAVLGRASGDADAAVLEQARQTKLLEIEQTARHRLQLAFGVAAAERAMARYRDTHRSAMLERASIAFTRITRGSFARLETQLIDGKETLLAVRPDGSATINDGSMSEGTRAQLYLALRIAAYHEFPGDPPPFVADDILETFDDDRARETFQALSEMAHRGQVIYLTHHAHLIEIARDAVPGVKVHTLPNPISGA